MIKKFISLQNGYSRNFMYSNICVFVIFYTGFNDYERGGGGENPKQKNDIRPILFILATSWPNAIIIGWKYWSIHISPLLYHYFSEKKKYIWAKQIVNRTIAPEYCFVEKKIIETTSRAGISRIFVLSFDNNWKQLKIS